MRFPVLEDEEPLDICPSRGASAGGGPRQDVGWGHPGLLVLFPPLSTVAVAALPWIVEESVEGQGCTMLVAVT